MGQRPSGYLRQYNVVNLDSPLRTGQVLVREMEPPGVFRDGRALDIRVPFTVRPTAPPRFVDVSRAGGITVTTAESIERLIRERRFGDALGLLDRSKIPDPFGRQLRISALRGAGEWARLVSTMDAARKPEEAVGLVDAYLNLRRWDEALRAAAVCEASGTLPADIAADLKRRAEARRAIG